MKDLIAKLEGLTGPDREVDAEITVALRIPPPGAPEWFSERFSKWQAQRNGRVVALHTDTSEGPWGYASEYTASLDAALGLVGDRSYCIWHDAKAGKYAAIVGELDLLKMEEAATAEIALVKAALKAIAAEEG